jgi:hypothetical protein
MSAAAMMMPVVTKEIRALLPLWAVCVAGISFAIAVGRGTPFGLFAYGVGALALGAQSIGQEFSFRTLPLLLSQPVTRRRLYWSKAVVLVPMVVTLGALAMFDFTNQVTTADPTAVALAFTVPVACGLLLAPWLTMVCRSPLAGVVFSLALPGSMFTLFAWAIPGEVGIWLVSMLVLCAFAGALGWQRFMRLEAIDAAGTAIHLPGWGRWRTPRPGHPLWMLLRKELRLQQLTFALAGFLVVLWLALTWSLPPSPATAMAFDVFTPLGLALLTVLAGALASAEERHYGMLASQLLLPVAAWRQWMVKIAVIFGLASLLATVSLRAEIVLLANALAAGSLYVSSVSSSAFRAVVASLLLLPIVIAASATLMGPLVFESVAVMLPGMVMVGLLVWFAFVNHRTAEPGGLRVVLQVAILSSVFLASRAILLSALAL